MIYLKHPKHGLKTTVWEAEAVNDEKHGWVRYDPVAPIEAPIFTEPPVPNFLAQNTLKRGPGRPRKEH